MLAKNKLTVSAAAVRPFLADSRRADEAGHAVITALMAAGYSIEKTTVPVRLSKPKAVFVNAIGGDGLRRGVFGNGR